MSSQQHHDDFHFDLDNPLNHHAVLIYQNHSFDQLVIYERSFDDLCQRRLHPLVNGNFDVLQSLTQLRLDLGLNGRLT